MRKNFEYKISITNFPAAGKLIRFQTIKELLFCTDFCTIYSYYYCFC